MAKSCILYPEVNGEASKLYKDLLGKAKLSRPLVNYLYSAYLSSNTADAMDNAGYTRNSQGQHNYNDVLKFLDFAKMQNEMGSLASAERQLGSVDMNGKRVDFTDSMNAFTKADNFNDTHTGLVATVVQHGDLYNIIVNEKNANTHTYPLLVKQKLKVWDIYKQVFNSIGIDINNLPSELSGIVSVNNPDLVQQLKNFKFLRINDIYNKKDALLLLSLNTNNKEVQQLISNFGSVEDAAQFIVDVNTGVKVPTLKQQSLVVNAFNEAKKFNGLNLDNIKSQVDQTMQNVANSNPETAIKDTLHRLNKKYKIAINEVHKINDKIKYLSDAATEALFTLQRQIRKLEKERGNNTEGKRLSVIESQLLKEINSKRYYLGMTQFLKEAANNISQLDNLFLQIKQTGTDLEQTLDKAKILQQIDTIIKTYYNTIAALADKNLIIDESISQTDIDNLRNSASQLKEYLTKKRNAFEDYAEDVMISLMTQIVGTTAPDGQAMINAVRMAAADSSSMNYLYSIGRASNPVIAAMGSIIRNAQDNRNGILNDISNRIKRATNKLYKESNSEFMYEDDGHIISDIDWKLYKNARKAAIKQLYAQGLRGFDLKQAIEDWEDNNTEDRVVDKVNGRTEKVPNQNYRKAFPQLTPVQQEYYDTMMQIKGEIGSLLPHYAQHQYLPPQLRRNTLDALAHANNIHDVWKAMRNKLQDIYTVREDDTNYNTNGIIDGDEYHITESNEYNEPLRQIPIFYINPLKDGNELLKNFSTGLQALAGTAINYDAMNSVADTVEFIGNFVKEQAPAEDVKQADIIENGTVRVIKDLRKRAQNYNTDNIIDSFINQYVYGQYRDGKGGKKLNKFIDSIVQYTSFKGLATNVKGAFANYIMGEYQMLMEAGAGEFYGIRDYAWAHSKLFGNAGVTGEMWDLLNESRNSMSKLFADMFDPEQENFESKSHQAYHKSMFRKLMAHDLSFIGYGSGEYLIHYVNMYAVLHHQKVKYKGKVISLYDAFEKTDKQDGVAELRLKQGVTRLDGSPITQEYIDGVRKKVRYVNQTCHGAMNKEDKGLIYQKWYGRLAMNFRQWMVEHYSRRFRGMHYDALLGENREGFWVSMFKYVRDLSDKSVDAREQGERTKAILYWLKDFATFNLRVRTNWHNMNDMQRYNCKRAISEALMLIALQGLSFALGDPDDHKKEVWRRWWIYQTRRMIMDEEAAMPVPQMLYQIISIMQSPFGAVSTVNSLLYILYGIPDIFETVKSGDHKGENKYLRNIQRYCLPFFKDYEQMQKMDTDDSIFKVFQQSPSNH